MGASAGCRSSWEGCVPQAVEIRSGDPIGAPGYAASCRVVSVIV